RRHRPVTVQDAMQEILARVLCPPAEVLQGGSARVRRLLPARGPMPRWWDVEFLPLRQGGKLLGILGRILPGPGAPACPPAGGREAGAGAATPPIPEKLLALREQVYQRQG